MNFSRIKKVRVKTKLLLLIFLILVLMLSFLTYYAVFYQNKMSVKTTSFDAVVTAKTMLSSMNGMMLNGTIAKKSDRRQLFGIYQKIKGIKYFKVVRGSAVNKEFGAGLKQEVPTSKFDKEILASKKEITRVYEKNGQKYLKVGVPFTAEKMSRGIDCLMCHTVKAGTVLGGVELVYSLKNSVNASNIFMRNIIVFQIILVILSIIIIYILLRQVFIKPITVFYRRVRDISKGEGDLSKLIPMDCFDKTVIIAKRHKNCMLKEDELGPRCWDKQIDSFGEKGERICKKCNVYKNSVGLFSMLVNRLKRGEKSGRFTNLTALYLLRRAGDEYSLESHKNSVFLFHLHILQALEEAIKNQLYSHHSVMLRQALENITSFLGKGNISYVLSQIGVEDVENAANIINSLSHKDAYYYQSDFMAPAVETVFKDIFGKLLEKYQFVLHAG